MERKHIDYPLALESIDDNGSFAGYASIFNITDSHKDIIIRGAFQRTLAENNDVKLLWQHQMNEPIGIITELREDDKGLYVEGKLLLDVQRGKEAYSLLRSGAINGLSIGYTAVTFDYNENGIRVLSDVDLWEISLVTFPANTQAGITKIKGELPSTVREFEHFLREAGFSRKSAKATATHGFNHINDNRDDYSEDNFIRLDCLIDRAIGAII